MKNVDPQQFRNHLHAVLAGTERHEIHLGGFRHAGVLVPLLVDSGTVEVVLTKRTEEVETHKGQVSFPGGLVEEEDEGIRETALREADEELSIRASSVETVGLLDDLATPTGFIITPVVGILQQTCRFVPNPHEVAEVFNVPLEFFADPANGHREMRMIQGIEREIWYYPTGHHVVWGATALIIRSLLHRLAWL
jgi:8-oxo-dGTP pyrophosphatase MutT (NUDIX family)